MSSSLVKKINFTDHIIPVCLPASDKLENERLNRTSKATVAGWGWTEDTSNIDAHGETSNILQKVDLPLINNDECTAWYKSKGKSVVVSSKQFCAGFENGGKDACRVSGSKLLFASFSASIAFIFIYYYQYYHYHIQMSSTG